LVNAHYASHTKISKEVLVKYVKELIYALGQLHSKGIAHRDIKPENIMLGAGKLRFIDFGFACFFAKCAGRKGTPFYMSPELYTKPDIKDWDKTDIFALGNTLFFVMTIGQYVIQTDVEDKYLNSAFQEYFSNSDINDVRTDIQTRVKTLLTGDNSVFVPLIIGMTEPDETVRWSTSDCQKWIDDHDADFFNSITKFVKQGVGKVKDIFS
jgi:serine/threonine protein kinase